MEVQDKTVKFKNGEVPVKNGVSNVISKQIGSNSFIWQENLTVIDLSGRNISTLDVNVTLPANLLHLNLSHNKLVEISTVILNLQQLVVLNLSHNAIEYFDDCPKFSHTLQLLDISYNHLAGPPNWVWTEAPQNLTQLNLSNNISITKSFIDGYFEELLQYTTLVTEVNIENCKLSKFTELLGTFSTAKSLCIGTDDYMTHANYLIEIPCKGLDKCCDLQSLKVSNTHIYTMSPGIEMYKDLVEINLAHNDLNGLPNEFCNLGNLEICVLSNNKILYLPEDMYKMQKLRQLYLASNELCMLPEALRVLVTLKILDLYDNNLNEVPNYDHLDELDLAQNYCEEPDDEAYLEKKEKIRLMHKNRYNGSKDVIIREDDDYSDERSNQDEDDEELYDIFFNGKKIDSQPNLDPPSSPEDWDSDEYWVPCHINPLPTARSPWLNFVKQKMKEGNFCPMDAHIVSVADQVKYERLCNPQVFHESDGQFDDYSSDDT